MMRTPWLSAVLFLLAVGGAAQTRIENPARPLAKNAGRVVRLEEVLRIRDDGANVIFRTPQRLALGPDESLHFLEFAEGPRLYRYGPDGRLIFKILKSGQGPGECQHASLFLIERDRIRLQAWIPPKIMDFSPDGRYLRETRIEEDTHGLWFLAAAGGKIYGIRDELFSQAAFSGGGVFAIPNTVYEISDDFRTWKKIYEFPVRMAIKRRAAVRLDMIDAAVGGTTLYLLHTAEYRILAFDLGSRRVLRTFSRAYDRVKGTAGKDPDPEARGIDTPPDPYVFDVLELHALGPKLLAFTSHFGAKGNDQEVDVFDGEGRFVDSVVLRFPDGSRDHRSASRKSLITDDGYLFIAEQEEDGLVTIGKYRIPDAGLFPSRSSPN